MVKIGDLIEVNLFSDSGRSAAAFAKVVSIGKTVGVEITHDDFPNKLTFDFIPSLIAPAAGKANLTYRESAQGVFVPDFVWKEKE